MSTNFDLTGLMEQQASGGFNLTLAATPQSTTPPEPQPPQPDAIITPSGGDDTQKILDAWNALPTGKTLMLSGMFLLNNTLWLEGTGKTLTGDTAKQSGLRPMRSSGYNGHYGAMFCTTPKALRLAFSNLEWDIGNKPVQPMFIDYGADITIDHCHIHDIGWAGQGPPCAGIHSQGVLNLRVTNNRVERTGGTAGGDGIRGIWLPCKSCWVEGNYVADTGHTGLVTESVDATVVRNTVERSIVQGTGMKCTIRQYTRNAPANYDYPPPDSVEPMPVGQIGQRAGNPNIYIAENTVNATSGGGLMLQDIGNFIVVIEKNVFKNCGKAGTTFGGLYNSNTCNNVTFRQNRLENCKSVAGVLNFYNSKFEDNTLVNTPDFVNLEQNCRTVVINKSGRANIGVNVSDIWVDGMKIA